jgi:tetratricopeptide (TPR) repeat protein
VRIDWRAGVLLLSVALLSPAHAFSQPAEYRSGLNALRTGRYREAAALFEKAVSQQPASESAYYPYYHLGRTYRCLGDNARAQQYFEQSFILSELGRERELVEALDRQLTANPPPCDQIPMQRIPAASPVASTSTTSSALPTTTTTTATIDVASKSVSEVRGLLAQNRIQAALDVLQRSGLPLGSPERVMLEEEIRRGAYEKARDGVRKIFRGLREDAVSDLEDARGALRERALFHLFLALAYQGAYLYEGKNDPDLLKKMEQSIRDALDLDRNVEVDPRLFSPLIRDEIARLRDQR